MTGYSFACSTLSKIPMPLNPAAPTKLIMCQPLGDGRRLMIEVSPDDTIVATPWAGSRQVGKPVQIRLSKAPRMAALVAAVRRALT